MNSLLVANNCKNKTLSYYLLYNEKVKFNNGNQNYLGILNNGQNFITDVSDIIDSSFVKSSTFLNNRIEQRTLEEYLKSINYDLDFFHSYRKGIPTKLVVGK